MKKFMFSAVALIAFSFAGMAKSDVVVYGDPIKEPKKELASEQEVELKQLHPCVFVGFAMAYAVEQNGGSPAQCVAAAQLGLSACMALMP